MTDIFRDAGLNEAGFYNYSRSDSKAPSDTYIRIRARLDTRLRESITRDNLTYVWSLLRTTHPMLDCHITQNPLRYHWVCTDNMQRAERSIVFLPMFDSWDDERNFITNRPRIINDHQLSQLRVYQDTDAGHVDFVLICSHSISDAISLVMCIKDFLIMLNSIQSLHQYERSIDNVIQRLPIALEGSLPERKRTPRSLWRGAILYTIFFIRQEKKTRPAPNFPWRELHPVTRQMVFEFSKKTTEQLIKACKRQKCTPGHLIYAASNAAFTELVKPEAGSFTAIGTPANARTACREPFKSKTDDLVVALAFLDVVLPSVSLQGRSEREVRKLWIMARMARKQVHAQILDDDFGVYTYINQERRITTVFKAPEEIPEPSGKIGSSFMSYASSAVGNLDRQLEPTAHPSVLIEDLSIGMRVRQGELLMHSYTFRSKLRLSLMYDHQLGDALVKRWLSLTAELMEAVLDGSKI